MLFNSISLFLFSALMLLQQAHSVKEEATGQGVPLVRNLRRRLFWDLRPVGLSLSMLLIPS